MIKFLAFLMLSGTISNSFGMIGIRLIPNGTISYIHHISPAAESGLMVGDKVISADGVKGLNAIDGDAGSSVSLTILRNGDTMTFIIPRVPSREIKK